ncbi:MAG TPA: hypothetical protein VGV61_17625, partial [Thermoanaerobaculia bacterium]|nr:hypothetical protein [Thermoanaerobaculia bacterium]
MDKQAPPEREPSKVVEAFGQLRTMLAEAQQLAEPLAARTARLQASEPASGGNGEAARVRELERRLEATERDQEELTAQLVEAENLAGKLMSLYVATYQLHVSLDPVEVQNAIAEIAKDLLGASSFVLLIKDEVEGGCEVALGHGVGEGSRYGGGHYDGGDVMVDATLEDGVLRAQAEGNTEALAAVPLRVEDVIVGALVILRVLD